jgi:hypothetical protein
MQNKKKRQKQKERTAHPPKNKRRSPAGLVLLLGCVSLAWPRNAQCLRPIRPADLKEEEEKQESTTPRIKEMAMARRRLLALASQLQRRAPAPPATQPWRHATPRFLSSAASGPLDRLKTPPLARPAARNPASSPWDRFGG